MTDRDALPSAASLPTQRRSLPTLIEYWRGHRGEAFPGCAFGVLAGAGGAGGCAGPVHV